MRAIHFYSRLSALVLFFFMSFLPFFFWGIDAEYNLNQQINRGYISRNAVFFAPDTGQSADVSTGVLVPEGESVEEFVAEMERMQSEAEKNSFVVPENIYCENQLTLIENILSSGGSDYFASVHTGKGRYVYFEGDVLMPPILEGRFFAQEECLSREPLVVIGKEYKDGIFIEQGKEYIYLDGQMCEVIGIAGINHESTIDSLYFINLGGVSPEQQTGRFYVDGYRNVSAVFERISNVSSEQYQMPMRRLDLPMTFTDAVTGDVYLNNYLKMVIVSLLIFIYLSILSQTLSTDMRKIGIMKVVGIGIKKINARVHFSLLVWGMVGVILTFFVGLVLIGTHYFSLPQSQVLMILLKSSLASVSFLLFWMVLFNVFNRRIHLREVTQQL